MKHPSRQPAKPAAALSILESYKKIQIFAHFISKKDVIVHFVCQKYSQIL